MGQATDVYGLAATLYDLLTGEVPVSAIDRKARGEKLIPPQRKNPTISDRVAQAILAGIALQSEQCPQSVQAWLKQLGLQAQSVPEPLKPLKLNTAPQSNPTQTVNWEKWGVIWTAIAAIVALIVGIPALRQGFQTQSTEPTPTSQPSP